MLVQAVVFLQIARIVRPQLAQRGVQKAAPGSRARAHEHQVLRAEQHGFEQALHVRLAFLAHAVFVDFHGLCARKAQFKRKIAPLRRKFCLDKGMVRAKAQALFFLRRAKQPHGRAGGHRLEQIGLALAILPADQVDPGVERKAFVFIIAKLLECERMDIHRCLTLQSGFFAWRKPVSAAAPPETASSGSTTFTGLPSGSDWMHTSPRPAETRRMLA